MQQVGNFLKKDRFVQHTGIELLEISPGFARAQMVVHDFHHNGLGTVQGGAIFTLADFTFAAAANSRGLVAVAISASINFMKAVTTGTLTAEAGEDALNPKLGSYTVHVYNEDRDVIAIFQGLAYRKKDKVDLAVEP